MALLLGGSLIAVFVEGPGGSGQPAAMEDDASPGKRRFLAFAPAEAGGVKIFKRTDYRDPWPFP